MLELSTYASADLVLVISERDRAALLAAPRYTANASRAPSAPPLALRVLPFSAAPLPASSILPRHAREPGLLLFVGTCHPVAKAGVLWLISAVFPPLERLRLAAGLPPLQLHLVGNGWGGGQPEPALASWVAKGMLVLRGKLSGAELVGLYQRASLFVSPLLNATGIATKNFHAMAAGLPLLTTAMGTAGLLLPPRRLGCCCDASASGRWPRQCKWRRAEAESVASLAEDCRATPSRLECKDWAAAKAAAAARRESSTLGTAQGEVRGGGAALAHNGE